MHMRRLVSALLALGGVATLMFQVGAHDAATNFCSYFYFWRTCLQSLPPSFDKWAWVFPATLFATAVAVLIWAPTIHLFQAWKNRHGLIDLKDAAAQVYGELRGTDLGRFIEGHTKTSDEILQNAGMQILHNAEVYVRRAPSPNWEIFPQSDLNKMGVHNGATDIRYWGQDQAYYSDPKVSRRDVRRVIRYLKKNANFAKEWSKAPPPLRSQNKAALTIKVHEGVAYDGDATDSAGRLMPGYWVFLGELTGGDSSLSRCQIILENGRGHKHVISKPFDLRPGEPKIMPLIRYRKTDNSQECRAFIYMCRDDGERTQGNLILGPDRYTIKVLSKEAQPVTIDVQLSKHPTSAGEWILEEVPYE
jgi:hypothetical protein